MTQKDPRIFSERRESKDFLISDSGDWPKEPLVSAEEFDRRGRFPEILGSDVFAAEALSRLASHERFAVLGVRPDGAGAEGPAEALLELAGSLGGFVGAPERSTLALVLPGGDGEAAARAAGELSDMLARAGAPPVFLGAALYPQGDFSREEALENAAKALDHALFSGPGVLAVLNAASLNVAADRLYQRGDVEGAARELSRALVLDPENVNVLNSLGVCHAVSGRGAEAIACFERAAALAPGEVMPLYNIGLIHLTEKRPDAALDFFRKALSVEPLVFEALFQAGRACQEAGRPLEAAAYLEKASKLRPDSWAALRHLGRALADCGRTREAAKAYEKALRLSSEDALTLSDLSELYTALSVNADIALSFALQSVELEGQNGLFHFRLARLLEKRGRRDEALAHYEEAMNQGFPVAEHVARLKESSAPPEQELAKGAGRP